MRQLFDIYFSERKSDGPSSSMQKLPGIGRPSLY